MVGAQNMPLSHQPPIFKQKRADIACKNAAIYINHGVFLSLYVIFVILAQLNQNLPALLASSIESASAGFFCIWGG